MPELLFGMAVGGVVAFAIACPIIKWGWCGFECPLHVAFSLVRIGIIFGAFAAICSDGLRNMRRPGLVMPLAHTVHYLLAFATAIGLSALFSVPTFAAASRIFPALSLLRDWHCDEIGASVASCGLIVLAMVAAEHVAKAIDLMKSWRRKILAAAMVVVVEVGVAVGSVKGLLAMIHCRGG